MPSTTSKSNGRRNGRLRALQGVDFVGMADTLLLREAAVSQAAKAANHNFVEFSSSDETSDASRPAYRQAVDDAREGFQRYLRAPSRFASIVANVGLDAAEAEVLALLCALELDARRQRLMTHVNDDASRWRPTLQTLGRFFGPAGPLAVAMDSRLRRSFLVDVADDQAWADQIVAIHPTVVWALLGDDSDDPDLPAISSTTCAPPNAAGSARLMVVSGEDQVRRLQEAIVGTTGTAFLVSSTPRDLRQWAAIVRVATLRHLGVVVEVEDSLAAEGRKVIERADHLAWAITSRHDLPIDQIPRRPWIARTASADEPTDDEWTNALGDGVPRTHRLSAEQLRLVSTAFPATGHNLDSAVRRLAAGRIDRLARRITPERSWDDIVLPPEKLTQLKDLAARYRNRRTVYDSWGFRPNPSAGVAALFAGSSGTGKTLAAEILAGDLALDLYKLDLSAVVSKYIGETEKNLDQVFDAAAAGNVVLFFDEADALFGKRTEVSDAHDRYANIETAYLLQRLESYEGVVVLATNLAKNIDAAFLRRLHGIVEFPMPGERERLRLWEANLSGAAPMEDLDVAFLARQFDVSGGSIRNASVSAAFLAAEVGTAITMETVVLAMQRELQKLGRLVTPDDLGGYGEVAATP